MSQFETAPTTSAWPHQERCVRGPGPSLTNDRASSGAAPPPNCLAAVGCDQFFTWSLRRSRLVRTLACPVCLPTTVRVHLANPPRLSISPSSLFTPELHPLHVPSLSTFTFTLTFNLRLHHSPPVGSFNTTLHPRHRNSNNELTNSPNCNPSVAFGHHSPWQSFVIPVIRQRTQTP